jgi:hypothetical protein
MTYPVKSIWQKDVIDDGSEPVSETAAWLPTPNRYLARLHARAAEIGWRCFATEWAGNTGRYAFECDQGHRFERGTSNLYGPCVECARDERKQRFERLLRERGFICLDEFAGNGLRYRFRCAEGHEWSTHATSLFQGRGCPSCAAARRSMLRWKHADGLEHLQAAAARRGGRCLVSVYTGVSKHYEWECAAGHRWRMRGASVIAGRWCRECSILQKDTLARLQAIAASHGGECLEKVVRRTVDKCRFRCARGHEWVAFGSNVLQGCWCRKCSGLGRRPTIERMKELAHERGGQCLSTEYPGFQV